MVKRKLLPAISKAKFNKKKEKKLKQQRLNIDTSSSKSTLTYILAKSQSIPNSQSTKHFPIASNAVESPAQPITSCGSPVSFHADSSSAPAPAPLSLSSAPIYSHKHRATLKSNSQSPFHQLKLLASVAQIKDDELAVSAIANPDSHVDYFKDLLDKLGKLSVSSNHNEKFLNSARELLAPFETHSITFTPCKSSKLLKLKEDTEARIVMSYCESTFRKWKPLYTLPDGNYVFNVCVLYLSATINYDLARLLRISVVAELLFHHDDYHKNLIEYCKSSDPDFINEEIYQEMRAACRDKSWCGFVSFAALATVLSRPIRLVHPIINVPTLSGYFYNSHSWNKTLSPIRTSSQLDMDTIHVLVSGNTDELRANPAGWRSNHFVLLLDPTTTPEASQTSSHESSSSMDKQVNRQRFASQPLAPIEVKCHDYANVSISPVSNSLTPSTLLPPVSPGILHDQNIRSSSIDARQSSTSGSTASKHLFFKPNDCAMNKFKNPHIMHGYHKLLDSSPDFAPNCASQERLQPGATILTGHHFMTAQRIYDILSDPNVAQRASCRVPTASKSNCYFILHIGNELMDYERSTKNKLKIQDCLRDGTSAWDDVSTCNFNFYKIEDGVLQWVKASKKLDQKPVYDLRAHRVTYTSKVSSSCEPTRKSVFWFWNGPHSPAPGLAIVSYLGPPYEPRVHGNAKNTVVPYQRSSHSSLESFGKRYKERTFNVYQEDLLRADLEDSTPPRSRQQVADAKYRERKACGASDCSKSVNSAQVCAFKQFI